MADAKSIIADAQTYAKTSLDTARPLIDAAIKTASDFKFVGVTRTAVPIQPPSPLLTLTNIPQFSAVPFVAPAAPVAATNFRDVPSANIDPAPPNTAVKPAFVAPPAVPALHPFTGSAPSIQTSFAFPSPPSQLLNPQFAVPVILEHVAPGAPTVVLPTFDATRPNALPTAPTDYAAQFEAAYRGIGPTMRSALAAEADNFLTQHNPRYNEQMAAIEDRLATYIKGGSALSPQVEDAIYSRTTRKVDAEYRRTRDAAFTDTAKRGFTMPTGALFSALRQVRQGGADNSTMAATEIAVKQAELEQQNLQFAVTTSASLRGVMLNASLSYHSSLVQLNGQALIFGQTILNAMIQVYDTLVKAYTAQLESYRAEASVYEARVRGALALVEVYKAEIDGFKSLVDADMSKVRIYQAEIETLNSLANMYRSQVETVVAEASLEKLKLEMFGAQVEAYRSESQAKASEYQGYAAAVSGEEAKFRAFGEETRAYGQEIEAYRAKLQAKQAEVSAALSFNEGVVRQNVANAESYRALVGGQSAVVSATIESQRSQFLAVQARFAAEEAKGKYGIEYYRAVASTQIENSRADVSTLIESAKITTSQLAAIAGITLDGAKVYSGLASAALGGINTLVSQSLTE